MQNENKISAILILFLVFIQLKSYAQDLQATSTTRSQTEIVSILSESDISGRSASEVHEIEFIMFNDDGLRTGDILIMRGKSGGVDFADAHILDPSKGDGISELPVNDNVQKIITRHIKKYIHILEDDFIYDSLSISYNKTLKQISSFTPPDWIIQSSPFEIKYTAVKISSESRAIQYEGTKRIKKELYYVNDQGNPDTLTYYVDEGTIIPPLITGILSDVSFRSFRKMYYVDEPRPEPALSVLTHSNELPIGNLYKGSIEQVVKSELKYYIDGRTKKIPIMTDEDDILPPGFSGPIGPVDKQVIRENQLKRWTIPVLAVISFFMLS